MSNKILLEVGRVHEIMGITPKLLLNEHWKWLEMLLIKSPKIFAQFDSLLKQVRRGVALSDSQIDDIVDSIKSFGKLTDTEAIELKALLKNDTKLREVLNTTDDFIEDLKKLYPDGAPPRELYALTKTATLSAKEITDIVASTVAKIVKTAGSKASKLLTAFEDMYVGLLDDLYKNGEYLNNVDEVYDIMDGKLNEVLKKNVDAGNISSDVAQNLYDEVSGAFRQSEKIKSKISELETSGRVIGNPKKTTTVKFNDAKINKSFSDLKVKNADGTIKVKGNGDLDLGPLDDAGESIVDDVGESIPIVDNAPPLLDDAGESIPIVDNAGGLTPKWTDMFFRRIWQGPFGETIVNIVRGMFRSPEEFIKDSKLVLSEITKKFEELKTVLPGDAGYNKIMSDLDDLTARLKSDMMLSQTKEQMFGTQWARIKAEIENVLSYADASELISIMGKSGDARVSIDTFLEWVAKNDVSFMDVLKQHKSFGDYWSTTKFGQSVDEYKKLWKTEGAMPWDKLKNTLGQVLIDGITLLFKRIPQLLTVGVFKFKKEILAILKGTGRLSGFGGVWRIFVTWATLTIYSNLVTPVFDLIDNTVRVALEVPGVETIKLDKKTPKLQFFEDLKQRIPFLGNDFSWQPFFNPIPAGLTGQEINDGVLWLGFEPAPLPNLVIDAILGAIDKDSSPNQREAGEKKLQEELNQQITDLYKEMTPEKQEIFKNNTTYNNLKVLNLSTDKYLKFYGLTSQEAKTLSNHMYFKLQALQVTKDQDVSVKGFKPDIKNMVGQTWVCSVNPITEDGVDVCNGESWRVLTYNDDQVENDDNFKKYEMDSNNAMARKYVYVVNKSVENDAKPNVGVNNNNLRPIKELLPKLKDIDVATPKAKKEDYMVKKLFPDMNFPDKSKKEKATFQIPYLDSKPSPVFNKFMNKESRYKKTNNMITERNKEKFGEDNFKHWKDTFTFKAQDEKNPGQYKEVKIKMEDVMDRINHYRKKYDEDDSFVRAVIDTHEDVVKIMFTKDLANIHESATPRGLALVLRTIKESRGEMEIFSVARPANGNWFLVKGDYTPNQLANMDLEKKEPQTKETEVNSKSEDDLKKKEESAINVLKRNEKEGIEDLPKKVRDKVREKMGKGWTTEIPPEVLKEYFTTSEINSIFNDKIVIYKLEPTREFFNSLVKYSARIVIKRGFCRTLKSGKNEFELSERQKMTVNHILNKCNTKYESKLGLRNF